MINPTFCARRWRDEQSLERWATDARHRVAQQTGRKRWYQYYKMDVAQIVRVSNFERAITSAPS